MRTFELFEELLRRWDFDVLSLEFDDDSGPRDPRQWALANRAAAKALVVVADVLKKEPPGDGKRTKVKLSRRPPDSRDADGGYFNLYGLRQIGVLEVEQPVEWILELPEVPTGEPSEWDSVDPNEMTDEEWVSYSENGPPKWFRFIAFSSRVGATLLIGWVRKDGGEFTGVSRVRKVDLLRWGDKAWALYRIAWKTDVLGDSLVAAPTRRVTP